uniref:NADH-cytochrome b5 reductase n=2 Tax=Cacopsylla melanoneura TaxID=428564 RepID=A0A8D9FIC2_9HEMI
MGIQEIVDELSVPSILVGVGVVVVIGFIISAIQESKSKKKEKSPAGSKQLKTLVDPELKVPLKLKEKIEINHDTRCFRFALPSDEHVLGLPIGQHLSLSVTINDEFVARAYTPVTSDEHKGHMDLVVKVYYKNVHPKFPDGGKMSQYLENMNVGDPINVSGPRGRLSYLGKGEFNIRAVSKKDPALNLKVKKLSMIAGGTGITPMLQLVRHITKDPADDTQMTLIFANQSEKDILLREELEEAASKYPDQFKLWYTVDRPEDGWKYSTGFVSAEMIAEHLFPPSPDNLVLMCGPPPMINFACKPNLDKMGYSEKLRFSY